MPRLLGWTLAGLTALLPRGASAEGGEVPLLLGGPIAREKAELAVDPRLPAGARFASELARPQSVDAALCSFRRPVCVQRGAGVSAAAASSALQALEVAYLRLVLALGLPPPLADRGAGGSDALDLYLESGGDHEVVSAHDTPELDDFDRAPAFCLLRGSDRAAFSILERASTLCVGEAIAWRLDAALTPDLRRAYAAHLWWTVGLPASADVQAIDDLQASPELAVAQRVRDSRSEGRALLLEYLDTRRSLAGPAVLSTGLLALGAGRTPPGSVEWHNEPDVFDVLRHSAGDNRARYAALLGDFALARAFVGDRDDGTHLPSLEHAGAFGRLRFDWVLPYSTLPRRVISARPIEPNGAVYVYLPVDRSARGAGLGFQAAWEPPATLQWLLVRIDREGRELSRLHVPHQDRATSAEARLTELDGVHAVIAVGTNLDGVDLSHPFDPDVAPFEPLRATLYFARL